MILHDPARRDFDSDNCAGVHPEVMAALAEADGGHQPGYGEDGYTARLRTVVRDLFGGRAEVYPVFNGTGANVLALQAMTGRWQGAVCAITAHLQTSECAAPEHHGLKLRTVPAPDGRLHVDALAAAVPGPGDRHHAQPGALSLSQSTELGTCYRPAELEGIVETAHRLGLPVHVDGARLANAAAGLGVSLRALSTDVGVDVLSLGATKNGGMFGDCVVVLEPATVRGLPFLTKATTQLPSKTRFVSAQLLAMLEGDLWLRNATAANAMAQRLRRGLAGLPGVEVVHPVEANAVFARLPGSAAATLAERWSFHTWDAAAGVIRLMTAFDTEPGDVDALLGDLASALAAPGGGVVAR